MYMQVLEMAHLPSVDSTLSSHWENLLLQGRAAEGNSATLEYVSDCFHHIRHDERTRRLASVQH